MFKTLEEANEWKIEQEKKYNDLKLAHEGLQSKLNETEKMVQKLKKWYRKKFQK